MSSNTLRGVGQEGDGEGDQLTVAADKQDASADENEQAGKITSRMKEIVDPRSDARRVVRSLDAAVPSPHSLDGSVPDAPPSLDAKVPALAATLMGVSAPSVGNGGRELGTVQGRDVHLPVEIQRLAGVRAIAGVVPGRIAQEDGAVPVPVERSEPTVADPVRTAVIAQSTSVDSPAPPHTADLQAHAPWYDQEPAGGDVYEERKPNLVGRVAIGVGVAAAVSVAVFAFVRMNAQNTANDETPPRPTSIESYLRSAPPAPTAVDPAAMAHPAPPSTPDPAPLSPPPALPSNARPAGSSPGDEGAGAGVGVPPSRARQPVHVPPLAQAQAPSPVLQAAKPSVARVPGAAVHSTSPVPVQRVTLSPAPAAEFGAPPAVGPSMPPTPRSPSEIAPPPVTPPTASKPAVPDRNRGKPVLEDPDSTMPLNLE